MPDRDLQAERDHAEWRGWMEAQGYDFDDDSYQAEAFAAGMSAARDLGDWFEVGDADAGTGRPAPELAAAMAHIVTDPDAHRRHRCPTCVADDVKPAPAMIEVSGSVVRVIGPAPELAAAMPRVDWARVSEAVADRERERDEARERLNLLQERVGTLAAGLKLSASASQPSKKSEIETGVADALLALLDPR